jgi:hypothetical protein
MPRDIFGGKLSRENFTLSGSERISLRNSFYLSYLLFATSNSHLKMFWGNYLGAIFSVFGFPEKNSLKRGFP